MSFVFPDVSINWITTYIWIFYTVCNRQICESFKVLICKDHSCFKKIINWFYNIKFNIFATYKRRNFVLFLTEEKGDITNKSTKCNVKKSKDNNIIIQNITKYVQQKTLT